MVALSPQLEPGRRSRILAVGVATLDLINEVAAYPPEDSEVRALDQRRARGGNAANTIAALSELGHQCAWVGTLAQDPAADFIREDLAARGIDTRHAVLVPGATSPTSYIARSQATGSRTIVHYRDLPELSAESFGRIPLDGIDWVHFEGRNAAETCRMLARTRRDASDARVSLELEKLRPGTESLLDGPDVLLIARFFALAEAGPRAVVDPADYLNGLARRTSAELLVLGWGAEGAWWLARGGNPQRVPAHVPERVVDTLGAGDILNAGVIDGLCRRLTADVAVAWAVRLAGIKCTQIGLDSFAEAALASAIDSVCEPSARTSGAS